MGVLQIWSGIAVEREHSLPIEDVITNPISRQVGVFDSTNSHHLGNF